MVFFVMNGCVQIHHGNGTQQIFNEDSRVLFVSLHRRDGNFYPQVRAYLAKQTWLCASDLVNSMCCGILDMCG
jgi:hypothetical protein